MAGRSIRIFLVDGTSSGVRTAELGLSTIKALVVPRASLSTASKRAEMQKTGVYVLVGADSDSPGKRKVYIGEGDAIVTRLATHNRDEAKDFWDECVLFVSKDENLTKSHVRYLEARLIALASEAKRATIANETEPPAENRLPESDGVEMEEFISQARLLLGALGYDLFEPQTLPASTASSVPLGNGVDSPVSGSAPKFGYSGEGFNATCIVDVEAGQFIVAKDSLARKRETDSLTATYRNLRLQLIQSGVLVEANGASYRFEQDYSFGAPTAAAQVVSGSTVNGRYAWKTADGESLADWQNKQLTVE